MRTFFYIKSLDNGLLNNSKHVMNWTFLIYSAKATFRNEIGNGEISSCSMQIYNSSERMLLPTFQKVLSLY